jgi:type 1 glutamine amidotransferase
MESPMRALSKSLALISSCSLLAAAAPIRVLLYGGCGQSGYVHVTIASGNALLKTMLLDPVGAGLKNPIIPSQGFTVDILGPAAAPTGGVGTTDDGHNLILALPSHDVLVLNSNTAIGNLFTLTDKQVFLNWASTHGIVGMHAAADSHNLWSSWDSLTGGLFTTHVLTMATIHADSIAANVNDAAFKEINAGLDKSYSFNEEWYSYQANPRTKPGIHVTYTLDENTYTPESRMGDHPFSWYRVSPAGGRFFYTGGGHIKELFTVNYWFRRQAYNAILWAAGGRPVSITSSPDKAPQESGPAMSAGAEITISFSKAGRHEVDIMSLDGKRVAAERLVGIQSRTFSHLKPNSLYVVLTSNGNERTRQLIKTQ